MDEVITNAEQVSALVESTQVSEPVATASAVPAPVVVDTRPTWLPEKFTDPEALAKSYSELEKSYSKTFATVDKYELDDDIKKQIKESDNLKTLEQIAKNNKLSNKFYNKIVSDLVEIETAKIKEHNAILAKEKSEIGVERINKVQNMIDSLGLDDEQKKMLTDTFGSNVKMFTTIENVLTNINKKIESFQPVTNATSTTGIREQLESIYSKPDYARAPHKYFEDVKRLNKILAGMQ